jgi:hypothetical protein
MDTTFIKSLVDEIVRLNLALHDMTRDRIELQTKYAELQRAHDKNEHLLMLYMEESRSDVEKNGVNIDAMMNGSGDVDEKNVIINPQQTTKHNSDEKGVSDADTKKQKRKEYMRRYMEKKRQEALNAKD